VNKTSIKIIKRKEAEAAAEVKTQNAGETKSAAAMSERKFERSLHRKMADTVSNWIAEQRKINALKKFGISQTVWR
jgi:predicted ATP-binding protein involved in virulence